MSLDKNSSRSVVTAIAHSLGEDNVMCLLGISAARLKVLIDGRGCLKDEQLNRISDETGKSWMRWGVDAAAVKMSRTASGRRILAATYEMLNKTDPQPGSKSMTKSRRSRSGRAQLKKAN